MRGLHITAHVGAGTVIGLIGGYILPILGAAILAFAFFKRFRLSVTAAVGVAIGFGLGAGASAAFFAWTFDGPMLVMALAALALTSAFAFAGYQLRPFPLLTRR